MKFVPDARLAVIFFLLLAALTTVAELAHPSSPAAYRQIPRGEPTFTVTQQVVQVHDRRPISAWDLATSQANLGLVGASALDLALILVILLLLARNGRYRQTLFAKAFRSSPLALTITSLEEGRYVDVNDAFLQMLNYERREIIGCTAADLGIWADPEDRVRMLRQLGQVSITKGLSTKLRSKSGEIREVNLSAELIELDGAPCVLAVTQDVTEAKRMENQLRQAQRMGAVGRLAGGVAHDFNNILTVIMGYSEVAFHRLGENHPVAKNLGEIKRAAERAASLTRQLLAFSRQQVLYPRVLDLNVVVNHLNQMLHRMIREDVSLSLKPTKPLGYIKADLGQVEQILMNLVVNARDAMPDGGSVVIETSNVELDDGYKDSHFSVPPGRYVMLAVTDTGCGMDEKTISHVFEPFFTTKGPGQGTGLGLSTVYGIVKQSEGYIWVYSELGKGTTFKLYFPRYEESAPSDARPRAEIESPSGSETILVVEDDEPLRKLVIALLENKGYRVLEATSGEDAITLVENSLDPINLLLTDVLMPTMSGVELSSRLRKLQPELRVLLMSGYAGDLIARHRANEPEMMLIEKPFTRHDLLAKIRSALYV